MPEITLLLVLVVLASLAFDYINGFHDTANAIATVVSTRVLSPRTAIIMAAGLNFVGALVAVKVAQTIAGGIVDTDKATNHMVLAAVLGGIIWNIITWKFGIPSSSSHALIGGLIGAAVTHAGVSSVHWSGVIEKVVIPLFGSPIAGFAIGFVVMLTVAKISGRMHPGRVGVVFRRLQVFSAAAMAFSHGQNDAQKSMGIITLSLVSMNLIEKVNGQAHVPMWVILSCATAMAMGTSAGGWRIIKTMGHRIIRLEPVHGFAAETSAATVIFTASHFGMPVSTTHVIAGSIFGVGSSKRFSAVRWGVAMNMVVAWVITLPASAAFGAALYWGLVHTIPG